MTAKNYRQTAEQLLPAIAYGDSAGLPLESLTRYDIASKYGLVDKLIDIPSSHLGYGYAEAGSWSDDTQLSCAMIRSILDSNGFDIDDMALKHVDAINSTPLVSRPNKMPVYRGWGGSTIESVKRLANGCSPLLSGSTEGVGNGVLMKLAPLALWQQAAGISSDLAEKQAVLLTNMTHNNELSRQVTLTHLEVQKTLTDAPELMAKAGIIALDFVKNKGFKPELQNALSYFIQKIVSIEDVLSYTDGKGFYAPQTLAMAYAVLATRPETFNDAIFAAVNMGGDTDSIASIVAACWTLAWGSAELPHDANKIADIDKLNDLSIKFGGFISKVAE